MRISLFLLIALVSRVVTAQEAPAPAAEPKPLVLLVVLDGLRPDYITLENTPNLNQLKLDGVWFENHHAVFPTVTRVNAASIVTGAYPGAHGLMDNTVYFPEVDAERPLSTADWQNLKKIDEATGGKLLLVPSLGEVLHGANKKLLVCSAGSSGSAYLLNHRATENAGALIHPEVTLPEPLAAEVDTVLGPAPAEAVPNSAYNKRAVDALLNYGLDKVQPDLAIVWLSEPDTSGHSKGMGSPEMLQALKDVDAEVGRIVEALKAKGMLETTNLIVTSDHGFVTYKGTTNTHVRITELVRELQGDPDNIVPAGLGLYFKKQDEGLAQGLIARLQQEEWAGPIFAPEMGPGIPFGLAMGTLSYSAIQYQNDRAPAILMAPKWSDEEGAPGFKGVSETMGTAGHGGFSPYEVRNTLMASGPAFKKKLKTEVPTGNTDLAPTMLHLLDVEAPKTMQGRVIKEALTTGPAPGGKKVENQTFRAQVSFPEGGSYTVDVLEKRVDGAVYLDQGFTVRDAESPIPTEPPAGLKPTPPVPPTPPTPPTPPAPPVVGGAE